MDDNEKLDSTDWKDTYKKCKIELPYKEENKE